jgi:hypothetical protein
MEPSEKEVPTVQPLEALLATALLGSAKLNEALEEPMHEEGTIG